MNSRSLRKALFPRIAICLLLTAGFSLPVEAATRPDKDGDATPDTISLSAVSYDFGLTFVGSPLTRAVVTVTNTGSGNISMSPVAVGDSSFEVVRGGCGRTLQAGSSCAVMVEYLPSVAQPAGETAVLSLGITTLAPGAVQSLALKGESDVLAPGQVTQTANSMVAQYTLTLPSAASWVVNFGQTTAYGRATSVQTVNTAGASSLYVAGMLPNTTYHMQATATFANGATAADQDQTFTTGALPPGIPASIQVKAKNGLTPQPGVELVNSIVGAIPSTALATDLNGNVIWAYQFPDRAAPDNELFPATLLPNGHFLCLITPVNFGPDALTVIREFDLAGNTVQQVSMDDMNARLAANGFDLTLNAFSHDIILLPTGHYLVIANLFKTFTDLPGYPGTSKVLGDAVVDLDSNLQPRWVWSSFDHLDINRHPFGFPDWTHSNSVAYSKDDGNLLLSVRHQSWVLKIDYENGAGNGNILWKLGEGGDFTLKGAIDPTDWFYMQHAVDYVSPNTTGLIALELFDNGDDRMFPDGTICGPLPQQTPCKYSTVGEMQVDENAMTASYLFHAVVPTDLYSAFAGNSQLLPNGNFEYNLAGVGSSSYVFEVRPGGSIDGPSKTIWEMDLPGTNTYRALRLPSLYPGVQW
ncbi:MAG TPA: aryl-sulfate sulfotransferase [Acidobacteriaceae bacterium]